MAARCRTRASTGPASFGVPRRCASAPLNSTAAILRVRSIVGSSVAVTPADLLSTRMQAVTALVERRHGQQVGDVPIGHVANSPVKAGGPVTVRDHGGRLPVAR